MSSPEVPDQHQTIELLEPPSETVQQLRDDIRNLEEERKALSQQINEIRGSTQNKQDTISQHVRRYLENIFANGSSLTKATFELGLVNLDPTKIIEHGNLGAIEILYEQAARLEELDTLLRDRTPEQPMPFLKFNITTEHLVENTGSSNLPSLDEREVRGLNARFGYLTPGSGIKIEKDEGFELEDNQFRQRTTFLKLSVKKSGGVSSIGGGFDYDRWLEQPSVSPITNQSTRDIVLQSRDPHRNRLDLKKLKFNQREETDIAEDALLLGTRQIAGQIEQLRTLTDEDNVDRTAFEALFEECKPLAEDHTAKEL